MKLFKKSLLVIFALLFALSMAVACDDSAEIPPDVDPPEYEVLEFSDGQTAVLFPGAMRTLKVKDNADELTFLSSDEAVAETDGNVLIVRKVGTATITAKKQTETVATLTVESRQSVTGVTLDRTELQIMKDSSLQLNASVNPENATNRNVTWKSSEPAVAQVSQDGLVTAIKGGNAKISVTTEDGGHTAECAVTVLELAQKLDGWNTEAVGGGVPALGLLQGKDGFTQMIHSAAPFENSGVAYFEKAFDAEKGVKVTFDYTQPCGDQSQWIMITFATVAPSKLGGDGGYGFRMIIRNVNDLAIQLQADMVRGDQWAEGGTQPIYSEKQAQHQTLLTNGLPDSKGIIAELSKTESGYQVVITNLYDEECTMTYTLADDIAAKLGELSDIYVNIQFNFESAALAPVGIANAKAEGVAAKAVTEVKFAEKQVVKYANDADFTLVPSTLPSDLAPILKYTSSDATVASVNAEGKVTLTGKLSDSVQITARAMNGAVSDSYTLSVLPNLIDITPKHEFGDNLFYLLSAQPVSDFSAAEGIACVSSEKLSLEIAFKGKAYLYFYQKNDLKLVNFFEIGQADYEAAQNGVVALGEQIIEIPVEQKVTEIRLSATSILAAVSEPAPVITAEAFPVNASNKKLAWESGSTDVLTVNPETGAVTLLKAGTAVITVKATDGSEVSASCTVKVVEDLFLVGTWTGKNGIAFDKDSTQDSLMLKYTTQNSTAINGIAKNSAAYSLAQPLTFSLNWLDNYLQNNKLQWMGFCLTNAEGDGVAVKYVKTQSGTTAGLHMTICDTSKFTELATSEQAFVPGNEGVTDFFYGESESAYLDLKIEKSAGGIHIGNVVPDNVWYANHIDLSAEQTAKFTDEVYVSILIQSEGTTSALDCGKISIVKK